MKCFDLKTCLCMRMRTSLVWNTYRSGNHKTREQVPETHEERHANCRNLMARSQGNKHHPVHSEVGEAHENEEVKIEELSYCPFKPNHHVQDETINYGLEYNIKSFNSHLQYQKFASINMQLVDVSTRQNRDIDIKRFKLAVVFT